VVAGVEEESASWLHRPGPSTAGMRWPDGPTAYGPRWSRLIFVGNADEAPDDGSPFVELLNSRRKVEEQLRALELLLVQAAAKSASTVTRFDF